MTLHTNLNVLNYHSTFFERLKIKLLNFKISQLRSYEFLFKKFELEIFERSVNGELIVALKSVNSDTEDFKEMIVDYCKIPLSIIQFVNHSVIFENILQHLDL